MYPCFTDSKRCQTAKTPQKSPWRRKIPVSRAPSFQAGPPSCLLILCGLTVYGKRARELQAGGGVSPPPLQISVPHVSEFSSHVFKGCCFSFAVFPRWYECSLSRGSFTAFSQPTLSDRLCAPREKCNSPWPESVTVFISKCSKVTPKCMSYPHFFCFGAQEKRSHPTVTAAGLPAAMDPVRLRPQLIHYGTGFLICRLAKQVSSFIPLSFSCGSNNSSNGKFKRI